MKNLKWRMRKMTFREMLTEKVKSAFKASGYDESYGNVSVSNRPDLCQYQCNGALPLAKVYKKKPLDIAGEIAEILKKDSVFSSVEACPQSSSTPQGSAPWWAYSQTLQTPPQCDRQ